MKGLPEERAVAAAEYIIENKATVRSAGAQHRANRGSAALIGMRPTPRH